MDFNTSKELKTHIAKIASRSAVVVGMALSVLLSTSMSLPATAANETPKHRPALTIPAGSPAYMPDQIVVMPKKGLEKDELDQSIKDIDGKIIDKDLMGLAYLVEVPKGTLEKELAKAAKDKNFTAVQRNTIGHFNQAPSFGSSPNDPLYSQEFYLSQLGVQQAWALGATGQGVVYGSIDSGVDYIHNKDLIGRTTGLLNGFGYQAYYNLPNGSEEELSFGHGTMTTNCFRWKHEQWVWRRSAMLQLTNHSRLRRERHKQRSKRRDKRLCDRSGHRVSYAQRLHIGKYEHQCGSAWNILRYLVSSADARAVWYLRV